MNTLKSFIAGSQRERAIQISWLLFCIGFFTATWDRRLNFDIYGFTIKISFFCFFLSGITGWLGIWRHRWHEERKEIISKRFLLFYLGIPIYAILTTPWSFFPVKSFLYGCWMIFNFIFVLCVAILLSKRVEPIRWFNMIFASVFFHSAVIIIDQIAFFYGFTSGLIGYNQAMDIEWKISRPAAFSFEPSYISNFLSLSMVLALAPLLSRHYRKPLYITCFFLGAIALGLTTSRTGWLGFIGGASLLAVISLFTLSKKIVQGVAKVGVLAFLLAVIAFTLAPQKQRDTVLENLVFSVFRGKDGSGFSRLNALKNAYTLGMETKGLGVGVGASFRYYSITRRDLLGLNPDLSWKNQGQETIMSTWGQLFAEAGFPGVLLYLATGLGLLWALWKKFWAGRDIETLAAFSGCFVFYFFSAIWIPNVARTDMWAFYGIWAGVLAWPMISAE